MKAAAFGLLAIAATTSAAFADTSKREAFEGCLSAGVEKFKDLVSLPTKWPGQSCSSAKRNSPTW
ncbi:hypothetical protein [Mesorhizobium sp.]|uniref:hypothetical protein n=1 Tax=Mesorhizobium sp. TaxID=1871066 RepID=UPI0012136727|nr:hypothetical protein [Mesorhizobium sp.]TIQ10996.1 MAG: hypothetical protein E5X50_09410 [Mesorhizobium sp.]